MGVGSRNAADSFLSLLQMPESITLEREKDSFCLFVCFGSVFSSSQMIRYLLLLWAHDSMPPQGHVRQNCSQLQRGGGRWRDQGCDPVGGHFPSHKTSHWALVLEDYASFQ